MRNGGERKSFLSSSPLDCEVGLGLKMQLPPYSCDGGGGGGPFFAGATNPPHFYDFSNGALLQRSLDNAAASRAYGCMMPVCGKALFTSSQLQELERQKMIHKYIMASIPVPPHLLLSTSPSPSSLSQCNTSSGLDLRYSTNGSDPEPWRCKRTDGKKWRCSRDVAPDQKYCERHAHKNRPRSRKHVEITPHNFPPKSSALPSSTIPRSTSQFPYDQSRCIEWLMRGGNSDGANTLYKNASVYHPHFSDSSKIETTDQTTRLFIDTISDKGAAEKKQWPSSSLSLSVCEGGDEKGDLGIGMMMKNQWVNPVSWMNSGGPLGEALCLGSASTIRGGGGASNLASPPSYGYSNSSSEDGGHALNFIG